MSQTEPNPADIQTELEETIDSLRDYKTNLRNREERAERGEKVGPGEPRELDMVDLAYLNGKISGIDAGLAALEELYGSLKEDNHDGSA